MEVFQRTLSLILFFQIIVTVGSGKAFKLGFPVKAPNILSHSTVKRQLHRPPNGQGARGSVFFFFFFSFSFLFLNIIVKLIVLD